MDILAAQEHGEDMSSPDMEAPWSRVGDGRLAEMTETRERIERAAAGQRAEMRAQQIRAAAEQANFETFMLRQEMRRGK